MTRQQTYTDAQIEDMAKFLATGTPNWYRETFGHWKSSIHICDSAPAKAAIMLRSLLAERQASMQGQGGEDVPVAYLAENADEAFIFFANDHESLDAYTADGFSITCLVRGLTQAPEQPPQPVRSVSDEDAEFFRWHYTKEARTTSNTIAEIELRILNNDYPTIEEVRKAYKAAIAQEKQL